MKACIVVYPGSNCDRDVYHALKYVGADVDYVGLDDSLDGCDLVVLPGGFSYGDYLRPGAVAAREKISHEVRRAADRGKLILGICNGFQILIEMGLLPGALLRNSSGRFVSKWVRLIVEDVDTPFTRNFKSREVIKLPVAHGYGRYFKTDSAIRVVFKYMDDVNGSDDMIAAVTTEDGRILGMMPHPERAYEKLLGGEDGLKLFTSVVEYLRRNAS